MAAVGFKQFGQPEVLREIGRALLQRFFDPFEAELMAKNLSLPKAEACDEEFFRIVADLLVSPNLPARLIDALFAIEEIARPLRSSWSCTNFAGGVILA